MHSFINLIFLHCIGDGNEEIELVILWQARVLIWMKILKHHFEHTGGFWKTDCIKRLMVKWECSGAGHYIFSRKVEEDSIRGPNDNVSILN